MIDTNISRIGVLLAALSVTSAYGQAAEAASASQAPVAKPSPTALTPRRHKATPEVACHDEIVQHSPIRVGLGQSINFAFGDVIRSRSVGNPGVIHSMQVGPREVYMLGTRIGTTNMMIQGQGGRCSAVTVTVGADVSGLQLAIADVLPEEKDIRVSAAGDALVLSGQVSDAIQAQRVVELAQHFVEVANVPVSNIPATDGKAGSLDTSSEKSQARVINMLTVAAPQQVMLEVKVAEVSKTLIDELGLTAQFASTHWTGEIGSLLKFGGGDKILHLKAQKSDQPVKILAEPSLLAISGQKASFTAGGKVFIPVPQATGNGGLSVLLQEETFGVKLSFTPTVLRDGVINLQVAPEVSQLSDSGASFSYGGREMRTLPIIDTRSATTTVQLRDGESFAIGGLMRNDMHGKVDALPGLGEIPVLGALFRSTSYRAEKTELVFVVTPHLVKPLPSTPVLPTASFGRTDTLNMITNVNMEGDKHDAKTSPPAEPVASQVTDPALDGSAAQK